MVFKVGTDCSGIEAPIEALTQMKVRFDHEFSCDSDKYCREEIVANHCPRILFHDMMKRKLSDVPYVDLYVCGFPCQSFSNAGDKLGFSDDRKSRNQIFFKCVSLIRRKKPKVFILENVNTLVTHDKGKTLQIVMKHLRSLKKYAVSYKLSLIHI